MSDLVLPGNPPGYRLQQAVLTTFDLDMQRLEDLLKDTEDPKRFLIFRGDGDLVDHDPLEEAEEKNSKKRNPRENHPPREELRSRVIPCLFPAGNNDTAPQAYLHGKVWLFEYAPVDDPSGEYLYRLLIRSANIFPYDNLENTVTFTGTPCRPKDADTQADTGHLHPLPADNTAPAASAAGTRDAVLPNADPLRAWLRDLLPFITQRIPEHDDKRQQLTALIHRLASVHFDLCRLSLGNLTLSGHDLCSGCDLIGLRHAPASPDVPRGQAQDPADSNVFAEAPEHHAPCGPAAHSPSHAPDVSLDPFDSADFLRAPADELILISPFISSSVLLDIMRDKAEHCRCIVVTNTLTIRHLIEKLPADITCRIIFLTAPADAEDEQPYIHAKICLRRRAGRWDLLCGSMNLTPYSMHRNAEFIVRLRDFRIPAGSVADSPDAPPLSGHGPAPLTGTAFLAAFLGIDEPYITGEMESQLEKGETPVTPDQSLQPESPVLLKAISKETRVRFLQRQLGLNRYLPHDVPAAIRYLLSSRCADHMTALFRGDYMPVIPESLTVTANDKSRIVYRQPLQDLILLGLLNFALHMYDDRFSDRLFSHRQGVSSQGALTLIREHPDFGNLHIFRTDVSAFGSSMDTEVLCRCITELFPEDQAVRDLLQRLARRRLYMEDGRIHTSTTAVQDGLPLCGFFENLYLRDFDLMMEDRADIFIRYGDDILIGASSREDLDDLIAETKRIMAAKKLSLNERKTFILPPGRTFTYLGWRICGGRIDLSNLFLQNVRRDLRCLTWQLLRTYRKAGLEPEFRMMLAVKQARQFVRKLNLKWIFQAVTRDDGLRQMDRMLCDMIRTVATGKSSNARFRVRYEDLQRWGYRSLVGQYYRWLNRSERRLPDTGEGREE